MQRPVIIFRFLGIMVGNISVGVLGGCIFANRHQSFPGDPTKFDANRPQARMFAQVDERIRSRVTVVEELKKEA